MKWGSRRGHKNLVGGVLTERDAIACRWVCEQGVMTVDQLWRAVWAGESLKSPRYTYERVSFLTRAGFLIGMRSPYSLKVFYKATRHAQDLAHSIGDGNVPLLAPSLPEIPHADGLTEIRLSVVRAGKLSKEKSAPWQTDRMLAIDPAFPRERFYGNMPDAVWTTGSGRRVAIEYERTRKAKLRVKLKVEAFSREIGRQDRVFDTVLWITSSGTERMLREMTTSHPAHKVRLMHEFFSELSSDSESLKIRGNVERSLKPGEVGSSAYGE